MIDIPTLSIVLPAFNESACLAEVIREIRTSVTQLSVPFELIIVDDGSTDSSWTIITNAAKLDPQIHGISLSRNFGKEAAILAGLQAARGQAVVVMDSDLQHPPELLLEMHRLWKEEGFDIVNAVKRTRHRQKMLHAVGARLFYRIFDVLTRGSLSDSSDFKLMDRRVVQVYCNLPERSRFFRGLVSWLGYRQASVSFIVTERLAGQSKWSLFSLVRLAVDSIVSFSTFPLHIVTMVGAFFLVMAVFIGFHTLVLTLTGRSEEGFPTVILLILAVGSILMISQGILGEYQAKIYEEVKNRPTFLVHQSTESLPRSDDVSGVDECQILEP